MTRATKGTRWRRVPNGVVWTVTDRWTHGDRNLPWVILRSDAGSTRRELAHLIEREWRVVSDPLPPFVLRVTFGQQYHREAHPRVDWAHPDGWLEVVLDPPTGILGVDYRRARDVVADVLGAAFAFDYDPQEWDRQGDDIAHWYPLGVLARVRVDRDDTRTWQVLHQFDQRMVGRG